MAAVAPAIINFDTDIKAECEIAIVLKTLVSFNEERNISTNIYNKLVPYCPELNHLYL